MVCQDEAGFKFTVRNLSETGKIAQYVPAATESRNALHLLLHTSHLLLHASHSATGAGASALHAFPSATNAGTEYPNEA